MALAKNLNKRPVKKQKWQIPKFNKKWIWLAVFLALALGVYGIINLTRIAPLSSEKKEVKFETGDRPLPQKIALWVTADGGLYMRANPESKAKIMILIPRGTELSAEETQGEWYKVTYMNKNGWVNRSYVTTTAPAEEPTKEYKTLVEKSAGFSIRYPKDWMYLNYGEEKTSASIAYFAFGTDLPQKFEPSALPSVILRITAKAKAAVEGEYKALGATEKALSVSNLPAKKFSYTSGSGVQMSACVIEKGSKIYILEETGGYETELDLMLKTLILN